MKKSRFTESQVVAILQEGEAGVPVAQLARKHGISPATYYSWRRDLIDPVCRRGYCFRRVGGILDRFTTYEDLDGSIPRSARWVMPAPAPTGICASAKQ